ncbi:MAG: phosphate ABC transporter permease PstA [Myxococcaceae bacterium]|nr:phosphate ABC transporter permease PstA [Myxococcaceae bacterium]
MTLGARFAVGRLFERLTALAAALIVVALGVVLVDVLRDGVGVVSWRFFVDEPGAGPTEGGIFPAIFGTVVLTLVMTIIVMPLGVGAALYLHEYASPTSRVAGLARAAIHHLAGVPSIVYGLFGLGFFVHTVGGAVDAVTGQTLKWGQPGLLWAACTLAVLTLPTVIVATEEALRSVPREVRLASLALGATRAQTLGKVVLPAAAPGILTAAVLAISRGAGEVAPVLLTGVASWLPDLPGSLSSQFMHLGFHAYVLATQSPDVDAARPALAGTVAALLVLTFLLNLVAIVLRVRLRRGMEAS